MILEPSKGRCFGLGVGPGDPELVTVKALRRLEASSCVAYFSASGRDSNARRVVSQYLSREQEEMHLVYPVTTEALAEGMDYEKILGAFYDESAERVAAVLDDGRDVAVLCEGDPFFHGSFMYLYNRLHPRFVTEVVPGVTSILAGSAVLGAPLVCRDEVLSVIPATLPLTDLVERLTHADVAVLMKVGRNLDKVRHAVTEAGLLERAWYVERATMPGERVVPLALADAASAPYFSMVVIPSRMASLR